MSKKRFLSVNTYGIVDKLFDKTVENLSITIDKLFSEIGNHDQLPIRIPTMNTMLYGSKIERYPNGRNNYSKVIFSFELSEEYQEKVIDIARYQKKLKDDRNNLIYSLSSANTVINAMFAGSLDNDSEIHEACLYFIFPENVWDTLVDDIDVEKLQKNKPRLNELKEQVLEKYKDSKIDDVVNNIHDIINQYYGMTLLDIM